MRNFSIRHHPFHFSHIHRRLLEILKIHLASRLTMQNENRAENENFLQSPFPAHLPLPAVLKRGTLSKVILKRRQSLFLLFSKGWNSRKLCSRGDIPFFWLFSKGRHSQRLFSRGGIVKRGTFSFFAILERGTFSKVTLKSQLATRFTMRNFYEWGLYIHLCDVSVHTSMWLYVHLFDVIVHTSIQSHHIDVCTYIYSVQSHHIDVCTYNNHIT